MIYDNGYNNLLTKDPIFVDTVQSSNAFSSGTAAEKIQSGEVSKILTVGDNNIKIDGENKRIVINDGTNDRVLIGYLSGKF